MGHVDNSCSCNQKVLAQLQPVASRLGMASRRPQTLKRFGDTLLCFPCGRAQGPPQSSPCRGASATKIFASFGKRLARWWYRKVASTSFIASP